MSDSGEPTAGTRPEYTVGGGAIASSHGERDSGSLGAMHQCDPGAKPLIRGSGETPKLKATLRSKFDYLTFCSFQVFHLSLRTCYISMPLMPKNNKAVNKFIGVMFWGWIIHVWGAICGHGGLIPSCSPCPRHWPMIPRIRNGKVLLVLYYFCSCCTNN